jgi:hypothetical protein
MMDCSICFEKLDSGSDAILSLQCKHEFHYHCIEKWFKLKRTCPICRVDVDGNEDNVVSIVVPDEPSRNNFARDTQRIVNCTACCFVILCVQNLVFFGLN